MTTPDHFIRIVELPSAVRGVTVPNDDGTFSIYINALYGEESRRRTLAHELEHLARDHFYLQDSIARQEAEAAHAPLPPDAVPEALPISPVPGAAKPKQKEAKKPPLIRRYKSLRHLEQYLRSIGAIS